MKVLLSAYACEPHRGSEPGVGWEWATRLSERHHVTVITRANNRTIIESEISKAKTTNQLDIICVDLPDFATRLKKRGILPIPIYYLLWQLATRMNMIGRLRNFNLVHHVTFNGFRFPGAWWNSPIPVVLGPLGGGSLASSEFRRCFGKHWLQEWLRGLSIKLWKLNPWTLVSLLSSDAVLAVGHEMSTRFADLSIKADLMLETAVPKDLEIEPPFISGADRKDFLLVGNLEPWKAWQIAFEAFSLALSKGMKGQRLIVIGSGRQLADAQKRANELGVKDEIVFCGHLSREQLWERIKTARGLVFSSIRDTSGNAALEAMALACPVICFNHQGVGWMTDDTCAIRIEPSDWNQSVQGFADGMTKLVESDSLVEKMGKAGRSRAMEHFSWDAKIQKIETVYQRVIKNHQTA
jgi:glycosyltransferase involved in cell wall biosynthesis